MPNDKNTSPVKPAGNSSGSSRGKKPPLTQQIKNQALRIDELCAKLQQKEKELEVLTGQTDLIEDLSDKLRQTVDTLTIQLKKKDQQKITVSEQAILIHELSDKLQKIEIKLAAASISNKHILAQNMVKTHMIAGMTLGLLPVPLFDIGVLTGTQLSLLRNLSQLYAVDFDKQTGKAVLTSLLSGALPVITVIGLSSLVKVIPGIGSIGGGISVATLASAIVYATGQVFIRHFEAGGTFQNFESKHWQAFFKQQFEEGKQFVRNKFETPETQTFTSGKDFSDYRERQE